MITPSSVWALTTRSSGSDVRRDGQRVVAGRLERAVDAAEHAVALVDDRRHLAVHQRRRAHHRAAIGLADRLVAEADAEDRHASGGLLDQVEADPGLVRRAGAGRQHDRLRLAGERLVGA